MSLKIVSIAAFIGFMAILPAYSRSLNDIVEATRKKDFPLKAKRITTFQPDSPFSTSSTSPPKEKNEAQVASVSVLNTGTNIASVTLNAVEKKISSEFKGKFGKNIRLIFAPWRLPAAYYVKDGGESLGDVHIRVEKIDVSKERSTMVATVTFSVNQQEKTYAKTIFVRGKLDHLIDVPVLMRPMHHGDIIKKTDIDWIKVSDRKSGRFLVLHEQDLIGHHPRSKYIKAGVAINKKDLVLPIFVNKSAPITAFYKTGSLELKMRVKALENGHKGDTIRVLNETSNKILYATVDGPSTVILVP